MLEEGDKLLDIGCGWGSIILESAKEFKLKKVVGITLSKNQYLYVKEKIREEGLEDVVEVYLMHYKDLKGLGEKFNKVVSVGMFEHVGRTNFIKFFKTVKEVMEEGGLFLLHTIGKLLPEKPSKFIRTYIFPGGYIPSLVEILYSAFPLGFTLIDIDNWRMHYYKTLKAWLKNFYKNRDWVVERYGEEFFRMWELYLVGSAVSFYCASNYLFQVLMAKGLKNDYPTITYNFNEEGEALRGLSGRAPEKVRL